MSDPGAPDRASARERWIALAAALLLLVLYQVLRQHSFWGDARYLMHIVPREGWTYHQLGYLLVARLSYWTLGPLFGGDPEPVLSLLSALCASVSAFLVYFGARTAGCRIASAALTTLLFVLAPSVWFYATSIEIHTLQLVAVCATILWVLRAERDGRLGESALVPTVLLCFLFATHTTSSLWAPALAFLCLRGAGRWSFPRRVLPSLVLLAAVAAGWAWLNTSGPEGSQVGVFQAGMALNHLTDWHFERGWNELIAPSGVLVALMLVALLVQLSRDPRALGKPLSTALVLLFLAYLPFAFSLPIAERGAYYISLVPVCAIACARIFEGYGRVWLVAGCVLVVVQAGLAHRHVHEWEHDYPGAEWLEPLFEDTGDRGLVLAFEEWELEAVERHSHMYAVGPKMATTILDFGDPETVAAALAELSRRARNGEPVAITRSLWEREEPQVRAFVQAVVETLGEPEARMDGAYRLFAVVERSSE
jgi:hypothetical protein